MSSSLTLIPSSGDAQLDRSAAVRALREMVLNSVASEHSKRNYAKALDEVFTLCANRSQGLSRALLMEYRAAMLEKKLSASTVNVRLSAVRKLIGEAQRNGIIDAEEAANLAGVPNLPQKGTRLGNWLTRDQAAATALEERKGDRRRAGRLGHLVGCRAICEGDWNRTLRCARSAPDMCEALPQEWWRFGTDQVLTWA